MGFLPKRLTLQNLNQVSVYVEDINNEYFNVQEVPETLTQGRYAFKIFGSDLLNPGIELKMELLDSEGNTIYLTPVDFIGEEVPPYVPYRYVTIEVYSPPINTAGLATLTILGEINPDVIDVPLEFQNAYNVKYQTKINVDLSTAINTQPIRFFKNPTTDHQEVVQAKTILAPISESIVTATVDGITRSDLRGKIIEIESGSLEKESLPKEVSDTFQDLRRFKDEYKYKTGLRGSSPAIIKRRGLSTIFASKEEPKFKLKSEVAIFKADMQGGTVEIPERTVTIKKLDTSTNRLKTEEVTVPKYKSKILEVIDEKTIIPEKPPLITLPTGSNPSGTDITEVTIEDFSATALTASFNNTSVSVLQSGIQFDSMLDLTIKNMRTFSGDIYRVRVHGKSESAKSDFTVLADTIVESPELLKDSDSSSGALRTGYFLNQNHINVYWNSSSFDGSTRGGNVSAFHTGSHFIDSLRISGSTSGQNESIVVETNSNNYFTLRKNSAYTISAKIKGITTSKVIDGNVRKAGKLYFHLSGSNLNTSNEFSSHTYFGAELSDSDGGQPVVLQLDDDIEGIQNFETVEHTFTPKFNLDKTANVDTILQIRAESGEWFISDLSLRPAMDTGFSPDEFKVKVPIPRTQRPDRFDFLVEYVDINNNVAETVTTVQDVAISGSAFIIDGSDNLLTGSLFMGNAAGSGIEAAGINSAFVRSVGYEGFESASLHGKGGFMIFSGSVLPDESDNYEGAGIEIHDGTTGVDESYLKFRTKPSLFDVKTSTFFLGKTHSPANFISGSQGNLQISSSNFELTADGDVTMSGEITATGGTIGGFNIANTKITTTGVELGNSTEDLFISSSAFKVDHEGNITASNIDLGGTITATAGEVGGWTIEDGALTAGTGPNSVTMSSEDQLIVMGSGSTFNKGDLAGGLRMGLDTDGTFKFAVGSAASYLYADNTGVSIKSDSFDVTASVAEIDVDVFKLSATQLFISSSEGGFIRMGSTLPTGIDGTNKGIYMQGSNNHFLVGNAAGGHLRFDGTNTSISSSDFYFGNDTNFISGSTGNIKIFSTGDTTLSGSSVTLATPKFFLGSTAQFISGSEGNVEISSSNFHLTNTGDVTLAGTVTATAGSIGGWNLSNTGLTDSTGAVQFSSTQASMSLGTGQEILIRGNSNSPFIAIQPGVALPDKAYGEIGIMLAVAGGSTPLFSAVGSGGHIKFNGTTVDITASTVHMSGSSITLATPTFYLGESSQYISGSNGNVEISSSGFHLDRDGNAIMQGSVTATTGQIGGFAVTSNAISSSNDNLILKSSGQITGSKVLFTDGKIAAWNITGNNITSTGGGIRFNGNGNNAEISVNSHTFGNEGIQFGYNSGAPRFYVGDGAQNFLRYDSSNGVNIQTTRANISGSEITLETPKFFLGKKGSQFVSGSNGNVEISSSNFHLSSSGDVIMSGKVTATSGQIAAWNLSSQIISSIDSNGGIKLDSYNKEITARTGSNVESTIISLGRIGGTVGSPKFGIEGLDSTDSSKTLFKFGETGNEIAGWTITSEEITGGSMIIRSDGTIESEGFASNLKGSGFRLTAASGGFLEVENARIRGTLATAVFEKETVNAVGGQLYVANSTVLSGSLGGLVGASDTTMSVANVGGFVADEILSAKKVNATGFATEYLLVQSASRNNPSSNTDFSGKLYVSRAYGSGITGDSGSLGDTPSAAQTYSGSQVIVSTGKVGTGFIRLNANPNDQTTPYIDIVERTGSGIYAVDLKARLGDLSGLSSAKLHGTNPSSAGFGLYSQNVFLEGGIVANTGSIGGIEMQAGKLYNGVGTHGNSNTGFYVDSGSNFSLGDKFVWDGSDLAVEGSITITAGPSAAQLAALNATTASLQSGVNSLGSATASLESGLSVMGQATASLNTSTGSLGNQITGAVDSGSLFASNAEATASLIGVSSNASSSAYSVSAVQSGSLFASSAVESGSLFATSAVASSSLFASGAFASASIQSSSLATTQTSNSESIAARMVNDISGSLISLPVSPSGEGLFLNYPHMGFYSGSAYQAFISASGGFLFKADDNNLISFGQSTTGGDGSTTKSFVLKSDNVFLSGSNVNILGERFFLGGGSQFVSGSNGNIEISSSNFHLKPDGDVIMDGTITANAGTIGGFAITPTAISSSDGSLTLNSDGGITGSKFLLSGGIITDAVTIEGSLSANSISTPTGGSPKSVITDQGFASFVSASIGGFDITNTTISDIDNDLVLNSDGQITASNALITGNINITGGSAKNTIDSISSTTGSFSSSLSTIEQETGSLFQGLADVSSSVSGAFTDASASLATDLNTVEANVSGAFTSTSASIVSTITEVSSSTVERIMTDISGSILETPPSPSGEGLFLNYPHMGFYSGSEYKAFISASGGFLFKADDNNLISFGQSVSGGDGVDTKSFVLKADNVFMSGSKINMLSDKFFLGGDSTFVSGSDGNIEISSSRFHLQPDGDVVMNDITASNARFSGHLTITAGPAQDTIDSISSTTGSFSNSLSSIDQQTGSLLAATSSLGSQITGAVDSGSLFASNAELTASLIGVQSLASASLFASGAFASSSIQSSSLASTITTVSSSTVERIMTDISGSILETPPSPSGEGLFLNYPHMGFYSGSEFQAFISASGGFLFKADDNNLISFGQSVSGGDGADTKSFVLKSDNVFLSGSNVNVLTRRFFFGDDGAQFISGSQGNIEISSSMFHLDPQNNKVAISGSITATDGTIGGMRIDESKIESVADAGDGSTIIYTVTAAGGAFYINGVQQQSLTLIPGNTYRFDVSDDSNGSHPFRFATSADGTTYSTGVTVNGTQGSGGAYVEIEITQDTPNTIYYKCTAHSGMGAAINIDKTSPLVLDGNTGQITGSRFLFEGGRISGSNVDVITPKFFFGDTNQFVSGSEGNIQISSSKFHLQPDGDVIMNQITASGARIEGHFTVTSGPAADTLDSIAAETGSLQTGITNSEATSSLIGVSAAASASLAEATSSLLGASAFASASAQSASIVSDVQTHSGSMAGSIQLTTNGMNIVRADNGDQLASYGATTTIGPTNGEHVKISSTAVELKTDDTTTVLSASAAGLEMQGTVKATAGEIGGFEIGANDISVSGQNPYVTGSNFQIHTATSGPYIAMRKMWKGNFEVIPNVSAGKIVLGRDFVVRDDVNPPSFDGERIELDGESGSFSYFSGSGTPSAANPVFNRHVLIGGKIYDGGSLESLVSAKENTTPLSGIALVSSSMVIDNTSGGVGQTSYVPNIASHVGGTGAFQRGVTFTMKREAIADNPYSSDGTDIGVRNLVNGRFSDSNQRLSAGNIIQILSGSTDMAARPQYGIHSSVHGVVDGATYSDFTNDNGKYWSGFFGSGRFTVSSSLAPIELEGPVSVTGSLDVWDSLRVTGSIDTTGSINIKATALGDFNGNQYGVKVDSSHAANQQAGMLFKNDADEWIIGVNVSDDFKIQLGDDLTNDLTSNGFIMTDSGLMYLNSEGLYLNGGYGSTGVTVTSAGNVLSPGYGWFNGGISAGTAADPGDGNVMATGTGSFGHGVITSTTTAAPATLTLLNTDGGITSAGEVFGQIQWKARANNSAVESVIAQIDVDTRSSTWNAGDKPARMSFKVSDNTADELEEIFFIQYESGNPSMQIQEELKVAKALSVGDLTPSGTTGRIDAANDVVAYSSSDIRFKKNTTPIQDSLFKIKQLQGVEFDWIPNEEHHGYEGHDVGIIAQEVEKVLPEVVTTRDSGYKAVKYEKMIPLLIEGIKEQQEQIDELKKEVEELKNA